MKFNIFKPISSLAVAFSIAGLSLVTQQNSALAGTDMGEWFLACFHPTGVYQNDEIFSVNQYNQPTSGRIYYQGWLSELNYEMDYQIEYATLNGERVFKVNVTRDQSPFSSSEACRLNSWTDY